MTLYAERVKVNKRVKHLGQGSFSSKVSVRTLDKHKPTEPIALPGPLKWSVGNRTHSTCSHRRR